MFNCDCRCVFGVCVLNLRGRLGGYVEPRSGRSCISSPSGLGSRALGRRSRIKESRETFGAVEMFRTMVGTWNRRLFRACGGKWDGLVSDESDVVHPTWSEASKDAESICYICLCRHGDEKVGRLVL